MLVLAATGCTKLGSGTAAKTLTLEEAKAKAVEFINTNLMQPGSTVSIKEASEEDGMYKLEINMSSGQDVTSYITKDGKKFFPQVMDIAEIEGKKENIDQAANSAPPVANAPKTDKPKVELFVMSFCPYGVVASKAMSPVAGLLGDEADINVRYIASIEGDDINQVKSLHGPTEGVEDARQLCALKNYGQETYWNYVDEINEKCYPIYRNGEDVYKACWQTAAKNAGMSISKLDTCVENEGADLIKEEDKIAKANGVSGSPTLIINGAKINAARNPEGYKAAICSAYNTPPEECETALSAEGGAAQGGCN